MNICLRTFWLTTASPGRCCFTAVTSDLMMSHITWPTVHCCYFYLREGGTNGGRAKVRAPWSFRRNSSRERIVWPRRSNDHMIRGRKMVGFLTKSRVQLVISHMQIYLCIYICIYVYLYLQSEHDWSSTSLVPKPHLFITPPWLEPLVCLCYQILFTQTQQEALMHKSVKKHRQMFSFYTFRCTFHLQWLEPIITDVVLARSFISSLSLSLSYPPTPWASNAFF